MKTLLALAALAMCISAQATDFPYTPGTTASFGVAGPFSDNITFTVAASGAYSLTVRSVRANAGCQRFRICGYSYGRVDSAQLQDSAGTPIADLALRAGTYPSYSAAVTLAVGSYRLHVTGTGAGTALHVGIGTYTVTSTAPVVPVVYSCDHLRDLLLAQGYGEAEIEQIIDGYKAQVPPVCSGD